MLVTHSQPDHTSKETPALHTQTSMKWEEGSFRHIKSFVRTRVQTRVKARHGIGNAEEGAFNAAVEPSATEAGVEEKEAGLRQIKSFVRVRIQKKVTAKARAADTQSK